MTAEQTKLIDSVDLELFRLIRQIPDGEEFKQLLNALRHARFISFGMLPQKITEQFK